MFKLLNLCHVLSKMVKLMNNILKRIQESQELRQIMSTFGLHINGSKVAFPCFSVFCNFRCLTFLIRIQQRGTVLENCYSEM